MEEETLGVGVWDVETNIKSIPQRATYIDKILKGDKPADRDHDPAISARIRFLNDVAPRDRNKQLRSRRHRPLRKVSTKV